MGRKPAWLLVVLALAGLAVMAAARQFGRPPLSPPAQATCTFANGKAITVNYSSPRVRGRKIFGGLVPYGRVWILGANQATQLVTTTALTADGKAIPAGSYTLFALPTPTAWTLILNRTSRADIGEMSRYPGAGSDFARLPMTVSSLPAVEEDFTVSFDSAPAACTAHFGWDRTRASIVFSEPTASR